MSTPATVPIFSPDGRLVDVPYEQMHDAISNGGKMGVYMKDPSGAQRVIPSDQVQEGVKQGGSVIPYNLDTSHQDDVFWKTYLSDMGQTIKGIPGMALGIFEPGGIARRVSVPIAEHDQQIAAAGASLPYRAGAEISMAAGANIPGMEQAAVEGKPNAVVAHAAAGMTPYVAAPLVAKGASVLTEAGKRAALLGKTPEEAYQSALKPSTTLTEAERTQVVKTGLEEKLPVSKGGLQQIADRIGDLNQRIKDVIASNPNRVVANKFQVASRLGNTVQRFANQVAPTADLNAISDVGNDFLNTAPDQITAEQAQSMKQGTYRALGDKAYGELKGAAIEAQKSLARGLKDELASNFPELKDLNAADSKLLDLQPVLERAVNRIGNHQLVGIGTPIAAGAVKAVTGSSKVAAAAGLMKAVLDDPYVKSRLAISLYKRGVSPQASSARIATYQASLGYLAADRQSASTEDKSNGQSGEQP